MPIYEFKCKDCGHRFEEFTFFSIQRSGEAVVCPLCGSQNSNKLMSATSFSFKDSPKGGSCAPDSSCGFGCGN